MGNVVGGMGVCSFAYFTTLKWKMDCLRVFFPYTFRRIAFSSVKTATDYVFLLTVMIILSTLSRELNNIFIFVIF